MIQALLRRGRDDQRGTALIEFALTVPILLLLFVGGFQLADASACKRRTTITARAIADMVSQYTIMSTAEVNTVLAASTQIMTPFDIANAQVRVSEVTVNNKGKGKITWSKGLNIADRVVGTNLAKLPADLANSGDVYIYSEVVYTYQSYFPVLIPDITYTQTMFMLPRKSSTVTLSDA